MDVGALPYTGGEKAGGGRHRKAGGDGGRGCFTCGRSGHVTRDCPKRQGAGGAGRGRGRGNGKGKNPFSGKGRGGGDAGSSPSGGPKCYQCGKFGHIAKQCPARKSVHGLEEDHEGHDHGEPEGENWDADGLYLTSLDLVCEPGVVTLASVEKQEPALGRERIRFGLDSGAAVAIIPKDACLDYPVSRGSEHATYTAAGGAIIEDEGERCVFVKPVDGGRVRGIRARVGDVKKPLMAVSDLRSTGHEVLLRQDGGEVKNLRSKA